MSKEDGGPAFPHHIFHVEKLPDGGLDEYRDEREGMSLRDYFAGEYAAAWIIALCARREEPGYSDIEAIKEANRLGLLQADAMLKKRQK